MTKTAVIVDGGFYRKRANHYWGDKNPEDRAKELRDYVFLHLQKKDGDSTRELYRILYYDCPPSQSVVYHPIKGNVEFRKEAIYDWTLKFFEELKKQRKVALRLGRLADTSAHFMLKPEVTKNLCAKRMSVDDLTDRDFQISFKQKGVDMRIGVDISSMAYEGIVNQIIMIAGDSDFVPAAKAARRKGIDFILDPMGNNVSDDLLEHIDGKETFIKCKDPSAALRAQTTLKARRARTQLLKPKTQ